MRCLVVAELSLCLVAIVTAARGADLAETQRLFRHGELQQCIEVSRAEVERSVWNEGWPKLLVEAYLTTGQYEEAVKVYEANIERFSTSLRLRMLGAQAYQLTDNAKQAKATLQVVPELVKRVPWRFTSKSELIALGEYYLHEGEDPKQVLELCFDKVVQDDPKFVEAHLAAARLAVNKNDDQVAIASLKKALALDQDDPEIYYLFARAWSQADSQKSSEYIRQAMSINPHHIPSLLWLAELKIDSEAYADAEEILHAIEEVNPKLPLLWALRAAIGHLQGKYEFEGVARRKALQPWPLNPEVDFKIGKCLADHYRFAESVEYQRRALVMEKNFVPAKAQLAQDLLRLGQLEEGWRLVDEVRKSDPYEVSIFNLSKLKNRLDQFATLEAPGLVVRMDATEAKIYGDAVLTLLSEARETLTEKYAAHLEEPVYVEIFPKQGDFAIRTFGLPGGDGFLGVCFGRLITANSPAALEGYSNWRSVLWHEYCHVVTLQKTKNRMPRWLSEGISVYEERLRDSRWGQGMSPAYRQMILGEDLTPVSQLSSAFLQPKSPMHLQFAYYEAALVVDFWIKKFGLKAMQQLLDDLSVGMPIGEAIGRRSGGLAGLDAEFAAFARETASEFGGGLSFEGLVQTEAEGEAARSTANEDQLTGPEAWLKDNPNSYRGILGACQLLIQNEKWEAALPLAQRLADAIPLDGSAMSGHALLARIYRGLGKLDEERQALLQVEAHSPDCMEVLLRLIAIDNSESKNDEVQRWTERALEIDPLRLDVHEHRAAAAEDLGQSERAVASLRALLAMEPTDPAGVHFRLARNLARLDRFAEAKHHVLLALEESPRYRDALTLLLELNQSE